MNKMYLPTLTQITTLSLAILLCACAGKVEVEGDIPKPLVDQKNMIVAVVNNPRFQTFQYEEKSKDRLKWTIGTGGAQQKLLATLLDAMFRQTTYIENLPEAGEKINADLILLPKVIDFQYAMPKETKVNIFEVWIKYSIQVYNNQGALIADWVMPAYGKTPTAFLKSEDDALNQAVMMALRDAGASFITGFDRVPEIKAWMEQRPVPAQAAPSVSPKPLDFDEEAQP
ncbi:hypothetical protein R50072_22930 [Simiduia litorea]|uniref:hypothetical protein n=1 Tax=Simiduia litorea TaxID=1435348 RepID=UPI0036F289BD